MYTLYDWTTGDTITAARLDNIETQHQEATDETHSAPTIRAGTLTLDLDVSRGVSGRAGGRHHDAHAGARAGREPAGHRRGATDRRRDGADVRLADRHGAVAGRGGADAHEHGGARELGGPLDRRRRDDLVRRRRGAGLLMGRFLRGYAPARPTLVTYQGRGRRHA